MEGPASPDPLPLDLWIEHEGSGVVVGPVAEFDRVGEGFTGDAQPQPCRLAPAAARWVNEPAVALAVVGCRDTAFTAG
jgi:hypothetical protein